MIKYSEPRAAAAARSTSLWLTVLALFSLLAGLPTARADITSVGDVSPADASTWTSSTFAGIGVEAGGTVTVDGGSSLLSQYVSIGGGSAATGLLSITGAGSTWTNNWYTSVGDFGNGTLSITNGGSASALYTYIGLVSGANGTVIVDGPGSIFTNGLYLSVGNSGSGTLSITNGGSVSIAGMTYLGGVPGSSGTIDFGANGGTLTTAALFGTQVSGTGTINTHGLITDVDTVLDSAFALQHAISLQLPGKNVTINLDLTTNPSVLGSGWTGAGSLTIKDGIIVNSRGGYLGWNSGSTGVALVTGAGSTWASDGRYSENFIVGNSGGGTLSITNGGSVTNAYSSIVAIGYAPGSSGVVTVDGPASTWTNSGSLFVGNSGSGTLSITNGASVSVTGTTSVGFAPGSYGTIDFGANGGTLTTAALYGTRLSGTGTINTRGLISDMNTVLDSTYTLQHAIMIQQPGTNITINLDLTTALRSALGAGWTGAGSLTIKDGIAVTSRGAYLGYNSGSTGVALVTGTGSTWAVDSLALEPASIIVGNSGSGVLSITSGGSVTCALYGISGSIGYGPGSVGVVNVDGAGSTLMNTGLTVGDAGSGRLSITNGGAVIRGGTGYIGNSPGSTGVVTVDGASSSWNNSGPLYVGNSGGGTLSVTNGATVTNTYAYLGQSPNSTGVVTVDGPGSVWNSGNLTVGGSGGGAMSITNGGSNTSGIGYIGNSPGSTGAVRVDGVGSKWVTAGSVVIGTGGGGTLSITNGGSVSSSLRPAYIGSNGNWTPSVVTVNGPGATWTGVGALSVGGGLVSVKNGGSLSIGSDLYGQGGTVSIMSGGTITARRVLLNNGPALTIDVGRGSLLSAGTISRSGGTLRILAAAGVPADGTAYSPISAGTWSGSTSCQAVGGTWSTASHTFTASSVITGTAGTPVSLDRKLIQRTLISDNATGGTGWTVGASFPSAGSTSRMTFTATAMDDAILGTLRSHVPPAESILSGWNFSTTDFTASPNNPIYFSFQVGAGYPSNDLEVWHYDGSAWTEYPATDLTYDGNYASFIATGLSGYAMVAVPEPGTFVLLATTLLGILAYAQRKRKRLTLLWLTVLAVFSLLAGLPTARADITPYGDISPANPSNWTTSTAGYIGNTASGTLTVNSGSDLHSNTGNIGYGSSATGIVSISGTGSTWNSKYLYVGNSGSGTLSISNGGSVSTGNVYGAIIGNASGSLGSVTVDGTGSTWLDTTTISVGNSGSGTLSISNGGSVKSSFQFFIGDKTGSSGAVTVNGNGSMLSYGNRVFVGRLGAGTLSIMNGGTASGGTGYVAGNSVALVDGIGSTWKCTSLSVGGSGAAMLSITNGGSITSSNGSVGGDTGTSGIAAVDGLGSIWNSGGLGVGDSGSGTLSIVRGATVNSTGASIGTASGATGLLTVDGAGSTWTVGSTLYVGKSGSGTLSITNGGSVSVASTTYVGATTGFNGTIDFGANGGTLTTQSLYASPTQLSGTGTVNTRGFVSDLNLVFDQAHGPHQTLTFQQSNQNVTVNLDMTGGFGTYGTLGAGWNGAGSVTIQDGITVNSYGGYLGCGIGSIGVATVTGPGSTWNCQSAGLYVGTDGNGALSITNRATVNCNGSTLIGANPGSTGTVTVDGVGSILNVADKLLVGNWGTGTLSITNGSNVSVKGASYVGYLASPAGTIDFGTNGGTLTTRALYVSPEQLSGTGTINTCGLIGDIDLRFDSAHGPKQTIMFQKLGQSVALNLDMTGDPSADNDLGVGWRGSGSLTIQDGVQVSSYDGHLGYRSGSKGVATVTGAGSAWNIIGSYLYVGEWGSGTLSITNGASVNCSFAAFLGYGGADSVGVVNVDGPNSIWTCGNFTVYSGALSITNGGRVVSHYGGAIASGLITVDGAGSAWTDTSSLGFRGGALSITGGGTVSTASVSFGSGPPLAIDVGRSSLLMVGGGTGTVANNGTIRILAGAGVPADGTEYAPISAGIWSGTGAYQAVGGTWDPVSHTFTASSVASGDSGSPVSLDLATVQRTLITDNATSGTGWQVGASFPAAGSTSSMRFTATAMDDAILGTLRTHMPPAESILSGWNFSTTDFTASPTNPIYISFQVGAGHPSNDLEVWHYNGSAWTEYPAADLTYDGNFASFTATGLSGYAMVAVPEPGTFLLVAAGLLGILAYLRRKQKTS